MSPFRLHPRIGPRPAFLGVDARVKVVGAAPFVKPELRSLATESTNDFTHKFWRRAIIGLTAWMDRDRCIFGFHDAPASGFKLHCVNRKTLAPIWSTDVWGYFHGGIGGGVSCVWAEMRTQKDVLILFGIDMSFAYIEGFSMKDGTNLFHFTTNYDKPWEWRGLNPVR